MRINYTPIPYVNNNETKLEFMIYYPSHETPYELVSIIYQARAITYQYYLYNPCVIDFTYYVINWDTLALKGICQIQLKELLRP